MKNYFLFILLIALLVACDKPNENDSDDDNGGGSQDELPTIIIDPISIEEGSDVHPVYLNIRLSTASSESVSVIIQSINDSAVGGEDFEAVLPELIEFAPDELQVNYKLEIWGDMVYESDETFKIKLSSPTNATIQMEEVDITILNDDINTNIIIPTGGYTSADTYDGMSLVWGNDFDNQSEIDDNWTFEIGNGNNGWGNSELQYYREENTSLHQGNLVIEAREENFAGRDYTSSRMITKNAFDFQYGRVDIRAVLPKGQGVWPALWMLGNDISTVGWPACGEIDIMEIVGHEPNKLHGTIHWENLGGAHQYIGGDTTLDSGDFSNSFHVFSIIWDESSIQWLLDDVVYHTESITQADRTEFHHPFFFIFNVAVGGNWPGSPDATTVFPQRMIVDYIRVFQ